MSRTRRRERTGRALTTAGAGAALDDEVDHRVRRCGRAAAGEQRGRDADQTDGEPTTTAGHALLPTTGRVASQCRPDRPLYAAYPAGPVGRPTSGDSVSVPTFDASRSMRATPVDLQTQPTAHSLRQVSMREPIGPNRQVTQGGRSAERRRCGPKSAASGQQRPERDRPAPVARRQQPAQRLASGHPPRSDTGRDGAAEHTGGERRAAPGGEPIELLTVGGGVLVATLQLAAEVGALQLDALGEDVDPRHPRTGERRDHVLVGRPRRQPPRWAARRARPGVAGGSPSGCCRSCRPRPRPPCPARPGRSRARGPSAPRRPRCSRPATG